MLACLPGAAITIHHQNELAHATTGLHDWLKDVGYPHLAARLLEYQAESLLGVELALPGPTGERNTLTFHPRGAVLCSADSTEELLHQLAAVIATGNTALMPATCHALVPAGLPTASQNRVHMSVYANLTQHDMRCVLADRKQVEVLRQAVAATDSEIVPVLATSMHDAVPIWRLFNEKCVCVNTTASGGNASLIAMAV